MFPRLQREAPAVLANIQWIVDLDQLKEVLSPVTAGGRVKLYLRFLSVHLTDVCCAPLLLSFPPPLPRRKAMARNGRVGTFVELPPAEARGLIVVTAI